MNLKESLKNNKLTDFIKARSKEEKKGDKDRSKIELEICKAIATTRGLDAQDLL